MAATAPLNDGNRRLTRLLEEARRLGVNVSQRPVEEIRRSVQEAWVAENRDAMEASNAWVEEHGLPLAKYRRF